MQIIDEHTDHRRWDAIEQLNDYGYANYEISLALDKHIKFVDKWRSRNRDKYENRPEGRKTLPNQTQIEVTIDDDPDYGDLPPTGYVSNLDHYAWGKQYAPHLSTWDRLKYQEDVADEVWNSAQVMVQLGRDHGKTWLMIKLFARWLLEVGQIIVIATKAKYDEIFYAVLEILQSREVREDYGDVVVSYSVSKGEIKFVDEMKPPVGAKFQIHKSESYITGLHFSQEGWIHYEDIVQEMKVGEAAERRVRHWYKRTARYIRGLDTKETGTATRKDVDDLYGWLEEDFHWNVKLMPAFEVVSGRLPTVDEIEVDHQRRIVLDYPRDVGVYKTLDCPNFPIERLLYDFIFHPEDAEAELNNNPLPSSGAYFDADHWISEQLTKESYNTYIMVDPAFGSSSGSSKTAILVLAIISGELWVIDGMIERLDLDAKEEHIIDYYTEYAPLKIWVEDNFNQMSRSFSKKSRLEHLPGLSLLQTSTDKRERIEALKFPFRKNDIVVSSSCPVSSALRAEYLGYSSEDSTAVVKRKYNGLDALSMAYLKLRNFMGRRPSEQAKTQKARTTRSKARRMF